jgi:transcriptional regulator with XRE-family HTH domain
MNLPVQTVRIVGANIRRIRLRKKMSQETLAELAGLNRTHMSHVENGKAGALQIDTMEKLATALDVHITTLLKGCR